MLWYVCLNVCVYARDGRDGKDLKMSKTTATENPLGLNIRLRNPSMRPRLRA